MEKGEISVNELVLIGVGGILGAGFFLASGIAIHTAGPIVILNYAVSAFIMSQVFYALSQMITHKPVEGTFRVYAEEILGDIGGFLSGWVYWTAGVFIMSSEVTASAIFTKYWFPEMPLWFFAFVYSILVIGINLMGTKNFGEIESWFSTIKIIALFIIVIVGILTIMGFFTKTPTVGIKNLYAYGGFAPHGIKGFLGAMLMSLIPFGGVEVVAMSAVKSKDPQKYAPIACKYIVFFLTILYISSITLLLMIIPWNHISIRESPFINLLAFTKIPFIASIMNFVILTAALTTMNGAMYGVTQVLYSLGQGRFAPTFLTKKTKRDVPIYALALSSFGLFLAVVLSYILPKNVYEYITSATGFIQFFNWIIILYTFIKYKPIMGYTSSSKKEWFTIILLVIVLFSSLLIPKQSIGFFGGTIILLSLFFLYYISKKLNLFDVW
ncbi:amino acid permease-associated region [Thermoanaerobacter mathranii subsp. mathranii str. A3]|uniref:Amino acid permease-associated region n=1 Tax=Thermoanaerobacter mathranii subsp. mathranii (strain DSM 11426 / CCUG 53645 / CIP 108742 / A3) TaxID=583358 RepID=A0ABM5LP99_THEM3|nr:amino acid permease [Thermoanaerobacter mathranii]ADH60584.1 amino acid permease-associated region [Thermoanaerobacter mathranii subsp. mathranii str. A3]